MKYLRLAFASVVVLCSLLPAQPAQYTGSGSAEGTSTILGKIFGPDGKTPQAGVRVLAYHLSSERIFSSEPSNAKGKCEIGELPFGYFDLAVETPEGLFVGNRVINLAPAGKATVIFTLRPYQAAATEGERQYPGSDQPPSGLADVREQSEGRDFWRSPRGVATVATAGALTLLLFAGGDSEVAQTPFVPVP